MPDRITVIGEHEPRTVEQLRRCVEAEEGAAGVLCADGHVGYSQPIGGAVAYRHHISPSGVGYDIGCGNKAALSSLTLQEIAPELPRIMDTICDRISFGIGRKSDERIGHPVLDEIRHADFPPQRKLLDLAAQQLGTVGAGNHYVDLFADEQDRIWVGVHFGSRGFGHKTASGFLALAQGLPFDARAHEGEMDSPPILLDTRSELGEAYISAMQLAGRYAYAGRDVVVDRVLEILGAEPLEEVHNHHNFAWRENHGGEEFWVVRKGCTPAFPGQQGFVGATMGEESVILEGVESPQSAAALYSTVHGAGRRLSRTQAAGKMGTAWECGERDCPWFVTARERKQNPGIRCPDHPHARLHKRRRRIKAGLIDYEAVRRDLRSRGIELRGGGADEAPDAYKRLSDVLADHAGTIRILHRLRPIGVAMAGAGVYDPFKD